MIYLHPKEIRRFLILIEIAKDGVGFLFSPRPDGQLRKPKLTRRERMERTLGNYFVNTDEQVQHLNELIIP